MIAFIKNYQLHMIKNKFMLLLLLNITDIVFTLMLLGTGFYREVNVFMIEVVQNLQASLLLKVVLPAGLLFYLYLRMQRATEHQLKISNYLVNGILVFYMAINVMHLIMVTLLPVFYMI